MKKLFLPLILIIVVLPFTTLFSGCNVSGFSQHMKMILFTNHQLHKMQQPPRVVLTEPMLLQVQQHLSKYVPHVIKPKVRVFREHILHWPDLHWLRMLMPQNPFVLYCMVFKVRLKEMAKRIMVLWLLGHN